jgi:hypothetical protein
MADESAQAGALEAAVARAAKYARILADHMGLRDWRFCVTYEQGVEHLATIACVPARRLAHVSVHDPYLAAGPADQRDAMVHELCHCHFEPLVECVERIAPQMGRLAHEPFRGEHEHRLEQAVDAVAAAWAASLPLPHV